MFYDALFIIITPMDNMAVLSRQVYSVFCLFDLIL